MTPQEILLHAADRIEREGWGQRVCYGDKLLCPVTAINRIADGGLEACNLLRDYLGVQSLVWWNDARGRTAEEVIKAMRSAAGCTPNGAVHHE